MLYPLGGFKVATGGRGERRATDGNYRRGVAGGNRRRMQSRPGSRSEDSANPAATFGGLTRSPASPGVADAKITPIQDAPEPLLVARIDGPEVEADRRRHVLGVEVVVRVPAQLDGHPLERLPGQVEGKVHVRDELVLHPRPLGLGRLVLADVLGP